ncbi:uncharacterized protein MAM_05759 [Metarhizium album ARSEF 1941]|uniref:Uncharacterized protein n=1 Tax=Metarhizium album (strain ARSEF 1941) TaxID=1081103 RepID=A0A0B2WU72_METAS|nr:uncharacterized protein MAM_05759 [Metarhizium album ARSEF 1941]KHN96470.1 hypothetical protein MAM_05759 [Metarhizium album ARSEF 1941]
MGRLEKRRLENGARDAIAADVEGVNAKWSLQTWNRCANGPGDELQRPVSRTVSSVLRDTEQEQ